MPDTANSAVIRHSDGTPVAQIDLIHNDKTNMSSVRLYNIRGVMVAEMDYQGDDDFGHQLGLALYNGYVSGRDKRELEIRMSIEQAMRQKGDFAF